MKRRKDGRYQKTITIDGKRISFYSSQPTEQKAEKDFKTQFIEFTERSEKGNLFSQVADEWEDEYLPELAHGTQKQYKPALRQLCEYFDGAYIKNIKPLDIDKFIKWYASKGFAYKTVKTRILVANLVFKYAAVNSYVVFNPCANVSVPKNLKRTTRDLPTEEEINTVKSSVNCTFGFFAYFVLYTGLRRGEAMALRYSDINFVSKRIKIRKSIYHINNRPHEKQPKTAAGNREIILLDNLIEPLKNNKKTKNKTELLFKNQDGEWLTETQFQRQWELYCNETGLNLTPHQLRHAYATILYDAGIDVKNAQKLMGHTSIAMTLDLYTHISKSMESETENKLNLYVNSQ